jgi:uncharacterized membrane protein
MRSFSRRAESRRIDLPGSGEWAVSEVPQAGVMPEVGRGNDEGGYPISRRKLIGLVVVFLWFFIGGIAHFVATEIEMMIVPPYIPWPRAAVLVSGVFELLGAVALWVRPTRRAAGIGLFLLTIAVTPCHIYMLQRPELFPSIPLWALWLRLPIQVALLALIAWCTTPERSGRQLSGRS